MTILPPLRFRPLAKADIQLQRIGDDQHPVVVIDDVFENPELVRELALTTRYFKAGFSDYYPGYEGACPAIGTREGLTWLLDYFWRELYGLEFPPGLDLDDAGTKTFFGLYCPRMDYDYCDVHTDSLAKLAVIVYLSDPELDDRTGTAFWRDRETGLQSFIDPKAVELADAERLLGMSYSRTLSRVFEREPELTMTGLYRRFLDERLVRPPFVDHDHNGWECIHKVPGRFNRLTIYPAWLFHSVFYPSYEPGFDIRGARLTFNTFISMPVTGEFPTVPSYTVPGVVR